MDTENQILWQSENTQQLANVLAALSDVSSIQSFLRDVMTENEITEISARLEAARLLAEGIKYTEIVNTTKLSSRTVARISDWMKNGTGGYRAALEIISAHHAHIPPARAE